MKGRLDADTVDLLRPAVEAGRKALRDMETSDVPAGLRRVAAYTGGKLPRPLAADLLAALNADPELRSAAAAGSPQTAAARAEAAPSQRASAAFLTRDDGWWSVVAAVRAEAAAAAVVADRDAARRDAAKAGEKAAEAMRRERAARQREKEAAAEARARVAELGERLRAMQEAEGRSIAAAEAARIDAEQAAAARAADLDSVRNDLAELGSRWRKARRDLAEAERAARAGSSGSLPGDPLARAKFLDEIAVLSRVPVDMPSAAVPPEQAGATLRSLPAGIAPDRAEAIDWIVDRAAAGTVVVDGYNVTFLLSDEFSSTAARDHLNHALGRLQRSLRTGTVVVVYDSKLAGERRPITGPEGIEIRFSAEGTIADDTVVEIAAEGPGPVVVISTDREVRDRAAAHGAITLWSEALVEWIGH